MKESKKFPGEVEPLHPAVRSAVWYVYVHRRTTDGCIFYVGKGKGMRAWSSDGRSRDWVKFACEHGRIVQIVAEFQDEQAAYRLEAIMISLHRSTIVNIQEGRKTLYDKDQHD